MLKTINSYFNDFIIDRVVDISEQIINNNIKAQNLIKDCSSLCNRIMKALPRKDKKLILRYEEKRNETEMQYFQTIYRQGFIDGFKAANMSSELIECQERRGIDSI